MEIEDIRIKVLVKKLEGYSKERKISRDEFYRYTANDSEPDYKQPITNLYEPLRKYFIDVIWNIFPRAGPDYAYGYDNYTGEFRWFGDPNHPRLKYVLNFLKELEERVKDIFWEYEAYERAMKFNREVKAKTIFDELISAYYSIGSYLAVVLNALVSRGDMAIEEDAEKNTVVLYVLSPDAKRYVGLFIGKQGANIKAVKQKLGKEVIIVDRE